MILEERKIYQITFEYKNDKYIFSGSLKESVGGVMNFLNENGFQFNGSSFTSKPRTESEILASESYRPYFRGFYQFSDGTYFWVGGNVIPALNKCIAMLKEFGVDISKVKHIGFNDLTVNPTDKTLVYCVRGGRGNSDVDLFIQGNFVGIGYDTIGFDIGSKTKEEINQFLLIKYKDSKSSIPQFLQQIELFKKIKEDDIILVPDNEGVNVGKVVSEIYLVDDENYPNRLDIEWLEKVGKNKSVNLPKSVFEVSNFDTEEMDFINSDSDQIIEPFTSMFPVNSKDIQPEEEKVKSIEPVKPNPFGGVRDSSAICILGKSGVGKTTTTQNYLSSDDVNHEYDLIIPSSTTTSLLAQYSPSTNKYVLSRLGRLLLEARNNPSQLYTAIIDECHKASTIDKINDELLQAISKTRNAGVRFISLDHDTANIYTNPDELSKYGFKIGLEKLKGGNLQIPDNFGFIFLSSNDKVISKNHDFYNRVDIKIFTEDDRNKGLNELHTLDTKEKKKLREDGLSSITGIN
jgi:hypothetical protein